MPITTIQKIIKSQSFAGILLFVAALAAVIIRNSNFGELYQSILQYKIGFELPGLSLKKEVILWINDGLMAIFFLLVGLEIKREFLHGELSNREQIILPTVGALGGMLFPALVFIFFNFGNSQNMQGWAIPAATDIAFSLAILSLVGNRIPLSIKIFLTTLAIIDDLGAIVIIAVFYTAGISLLPISLATAALAVLFTLNKFRINRLFPYILMGAILWLAILKSGIHATIGGVLLAFCIPAGNSTADHSPLVKLEHSLHAFVAYIIMPIFAFTNSGLDLSGLSLSSLFQPLPLGIALGLFIGKQAGVFTLSWLSIKAGWAKLPTDSNWLQFYGVSLITGVGFTMSLFIASLAFSSPDFESQTRLGIIVGSLLSGICGYIVLLWACRPLK